VRVLDVHAMGKLRHWMWRAKWVFFGIAAIFVIACLRMGWSDAWETLVGRRSPKNASYPYLSWPLSAIGWLALPALIAGVVAYLIASQADLRRSRTVSEAAARVPFRSRRKLARGGVPHWFERTLDVVAAGPLKDSFVVPLVALHMNDFGWADRCWRALVNALLDEAVQAESIEPPFRRAWAEEEAIQVLLSAVKSNPPYCTSCGPKPEATG
jgi:hypothetical protein